ASRQEIGWEIKAIQHPGSQIELDNLKLAPEKMQQYFLSTTVLRPQDALNLQIELRFWPVLLSNRRDKALTATLNDVFGLKAESFQLLPNNQLMVLFDDFSLP